jgi:hypothetical protein
MAVKTSWNAGDVLTAADLTDTFATKAALASPAFTGSPTLNGSPLTSGKILQVVTVTKTDTFSTTSTTPVDVTGLSVTITPASASSKVLVVATIPLGHSASAVDQAAFAQLLRGSTEVFRGDAAGSRTRAIGATSVHATDWGHSWGIFHIAAHFIDEPASASALTYKVQAWQSGGSGAFIGSSGVDADAVRYARVPSSLTVMEVVA